MQMTNWWDRYMGKPWVAIPNPPHSYTCGELVKYSLKELHGIDMPCIEANAAILRECINEMKPAKFGMVPLAENEDKREFDVVFLMRATREDHVGIAAMTCEGLRILHCHQGIGVTMDSPAELTALGYRHMKWYRHKDMACRA